MDVAYQPDRGDFISLDFTPQAGPEQPGRRPAFVLSPRDFNIATGLAVVYPLTNTQTGSRFEVPVPRGRKLTRNAPLHKSILPSTGERATAPQRGGNESRRGAAPTATQETSTRRGSRRPSPS